MSTQSFASYLTQAASVNNFSTGVDWLSSFFPAFDIAPTSAQMQGVNLVIKGQIAISDQAQSPFTTASGLSAFTSFLPTFSTTQDFTLTIMPATGKDQNQITAKLVLPIAGSYSLPIPSSTQTTPNLSGVSLTLTLVDTSPVTASFAVGGTMDMTLYQSQTVSMQASASLTVSNDEVTAVQVSLDDTFSQPLKTPEVLGNRLALSNIGASLGINFEPPGCLVGLEGSGTITTPNNTIDIENAAIVCDVEGDVPIPIYLGLTANQLNLSDFLGIVGQELPLPSIPVTFNNPSMYYCKQGVTLPDGKVVAQGFSASSEVDLFGFNFYGSCTYADGQSVSAAFQTDGPIDICGILTLSGAGTGTKKKSGVDNFSLPTNAQEWKAWQSETGGTVAYKPGGAYLTLDLNRGNSNPTFTSDIAVEFMGETAALAVATLQNDSINLSVSIAQNTFTGTFSVSKNSITGSFSFELGSLVSIFNDDGMTPLGSLVGGYSMQATFGGTTGDMVSTSISLAGDTIPIMTNQAFELGSFSNMISELVSGITSPGTNPLFNGLKKNPEVWACAIQNYVILPGQNITDKAKFATEALHELGVAPGFSENYAGAPVNPFPGLISQMQGALGYGASDMATALYNFSTTHGSMTPMLATDAGKILTEVGKAIPSVPGFVAGEIASALHLGTTFSASIQDLATVFQFATTPIKTAATAIENVFPGEAKAIGEAMKGAGYAASDVWNEFKSLGGDFASAAEEVASAIGSAFNPANW